jgi:hypothetical protein
MVAHLMAIMIFFLIKTYQSSIKQSTQQRGKKKVQDGRTQVLANQKFFKEGRPLRE